jgi:hypothetical protein
MAPLLVRIDVATKTYTLYVYGERDVSIQSDQLLDAAFVERFRVNTDDVMKMVDGV